MAERKYTNRKPKGQVPKKKRTVIRGCKDLIYVNVQGREKNNKFCLRTEPVQFFPKSQRYRSAQNFINKLHPNATKEILQELSLYPRIGDGSLSARAEVEEITDPYFSAHRLLIDDVTSIEPRRRSLHRGVRPVTQEEYFEAIRKKTRAVQNLAPSLGAIRTNLSENPKVSVKKLQKYLQNIPDTFIKETVPADLKSREIKAEKNTLAFDIFQVNQYAPNDPEMTRLKKMIFDSSKYYCRRVLEQQHFLPNDKGEYMLCPKSAAKLIKDNILVEEDASIQNKIDNAEFICIAIAEPSKRLVAFALSQSLIEKKEKWMYLLLFCASQDASHGLQLPTRYPVRFYNYWEQEMEKQGYKNFALYSMKTAERFWWQRKFRYSKCKKTEEKFCGRGREIWMYKCLSHS